MNTDRGVFARRSMLTVACLVIAVGCQGGSVSTAEHGTPSLTAGDTTATFSTKGAAACPASPIPPGIYVKDITSSDVSKLPPDLAVIAGKWTLAIGVADLHCFYGSWATLEVGGAVVFVDAHPFTVIGPNEIELHGAQEPIGTYRVSATDGKLRYVPIDDPSFARPEVMSIGSLWTLDQDLIGS